MKRFTLTDRTTLDLRASAAQELAYLRAMGSDNDLVLATSNLGGYEAILHLIASEEAGVPVYELVSSVQTKYASHGGLISRLRVLRDHGLLESVPGRKRSQVCLTPSKAFLERLGPILTKRNGL